MRFQGFIGPSYTMPSVNIDCQRCVNLYPEINTQGTGKDHEVMSLVPTPGLKLLCTLPQSPVRGVYYSSNLQLFAVAGNKLYSITSAWAYTEIGTLATSSGRVSMKDNGTNLFIVDGTNGYVWTFLTSAFAQVTDPNFNGADQVDFVDQYFTFTKQGSGKWQISRLNDVTFDPLDIALAEGSPDNNVGHVVNNQNVFIFGTQSTEVYYDSGDTFPFARIQGAVLDVGCAATFTIARLANSVFFLGGDDNGHGIVYQMQGYQPQRISNPAVESVIRSVSNDLISQAKAWTYQQGGHAFYCLNLPNVNSTWVYDASTSMWHERTYLNLWSLERHRADCHANAFSKNIVGDYQTGAIYELDPGTTSDNGTSIARIRSAPHISENMENIIHDRFQLDMEVGVGLDGLGNGVAPKAILRWTDDGGHTWSNEHFADIGPIGKTKTRVIWRRLGASRDRVYEVKITDPVRTYLVGADIQTRGCAS